ncbi:MAG: GNAT family N-acetyltransferase [bacterium]
MALEIKEIRSLEDVREIVLMNNRVWNNSTGIIDLLSLSTKCYLAVKGGKVAGYAFLERDARGFDELVDIVVDPDERSQGIGSFILGHVKAAHPFLKLMVRCVREDVQAFYASNGFTKEERVENYYGTNIDGFRMVWKR